MVYDSLRLDARERALVHDLVHVKMELNDGKIGEPAVRNQKRLRCTPTLYASKANSMGSSAMNCRNDTRWTCVR